MTGKKQRIARLAAALGPTRLMEMLPKRPALLVLNYHRIGDAKATPFDSGVFSCSAEELDQHVAYLKTQFRIVDLAEALQVLLGERPLQSPALLLTFDDGYLDNYQLAFPILRRHGVPATFFLPTSFIGTGKLPWWDTIAYLVKRSDREWIELDWPVRRRFSLMGAERERSIEAVLDLYKGPLVTELEPFLLEMERACGVTRADAGLQDTLPRAFLSWDEAREMQAAGMSFGSHTHTHQILSRLTVDEQREELRVSREMLERELGGTVDTLAYPVGSRGSFNEATMQALRDTGYRCAFSFVKGVNVPGRVGRFEVLRTGVFSGSPAMLRFRSSFHALTGKFRT